MASSGDDPYDWTVDQVVKAFCDDHSSWWTSRTPPVLPPPAILEQALRENDLNGLSLLTQLDNTSLRQDLNITSLGHRGTFIKAINTLRDRSRAYREDVLVSRRVSMLAHDNDLGPASPLTPSLLHGPTSLLPQPTSSRSSGQYFLPPGLAPHRESETAPSGMRTPGSAEEAFGEHNAASDTSPETVGRPLSDPPPVDGLRRAASSSPPREARTGEHIIIDESGRKRRKLDLDATQRQRSSGDKVADDRAPTRITSTSITHKVAKQQIEDPAESEGYLGPRALPVHRLFYGSSSFGQELSNDVTYAKPDDNAPDDSDSYAFASTNISAGRRLYLNQVMKHFLLQTERSDFHQDGKLYTGIQPYASRLEVKQQNPSFTLFAAQPDGRVSATREDLAFWPAFGNDQAPGQARLDLPSKELLKPDEHGEDWSRYEKYFYMDNVTIVSATRGESDSDSEYDSEAQKEMDKERAERDAELHKRSRYLTHDDIGKAITQAESELIERWRETKLPRRELKAWSLWRQSRRQRTKRSQVLEATRQIDYFNQTRLPKLRAEITSMLWTDAKHIRQQCRVMEQTIFDREDLVWTIAVLQRSNQPSRPPPAARRNLPKVQSLQDPDDAEVDVLESDSEAEDVASEDSMEAFVQPDDDPEAPSEIAADAVVADARDAERSEDGDDDDNIISSAAKMRCRPLPSADSLAPPAIVAPIVDVAVPARAPPESDGSQPDDMEAQQRTRVSAEEIAKLPSTSVIDLTMTSDDSAGEDSASVSVEPGPSHGNPFREPKSAGVGAETLHRTPPLRHSRLRQRLQDASETVEVVDPIAVDDEEELDYSDAEAINKRPYAYYQKRQDRMGMLVKLVNNMNTPRREELVRRIAVVPVEDLRPEVWHALKAIRDNRKRIRGADDRTFEELSRFARLYLTWYDCHKRSVEEGWPLKIINRALQDAGQFAPFQRSLRHILQSYSSDLSDGEPVNVVTKLGPSPRRKRKRPVMENAQARNVREADRDRIEEQARRQQELKQRLHIEDTSLNDDPSRIVVNPGKFDHQPFIYLNPEIGKHIKPHQVNGVRFMWREIVMDTMGQGCLLAHTMGLGKTMQIITLLVTVAEAAASADPEVSAQIPLAMRQSRSLILCPPTLLDNWWDEFLMWVPSPLEQSIGHLRKVHSLLSKEERLRELRAWYDEGGVLLIGYDMYRNLVHNKTTAARKPSLAEEEHGLIKQLLLEGPHIIVADEAHKMKNRDSSISLATSQLRSRSRIALTGSPLANNLEEYHSMIDWVAPGYLGSSAEFRAKYKEPIEAGLYFDSTPAERRFSARRLLVLNRDLDPKVQRADLSVLKSDLPPKTEFVIKVPLTEIQNKAYRLYVSSILSHAADVGQTRLLDWLAVLSLLCNHPICFRDKLLERDEHRRSVALSAAIVLDEITDVGSAPGDAPITKLEMSKAMIEAEMDLLSSVGEGLSSTEHSHKAQVFDQLLDAAVAAGDKTLVFSHSLPTLGYLQGRFDATRRRYCKLTGETKISERQHDTKAFNKGDFDVYLISTRAGGLGLNLWGANRVIIYDFSFNPMWEEQAIGRAYRIGQTKPVYVYRFTAGGTFEDRIYNKSIFKLQLASRVVDKKRPVRHAQRNSTRDHLFDPLPVEQKDLSEVRGKDPLVLDRLLAQVDQDQLAIRSIELTETIHRDDDEALTAEDRQMADQEWRDTQLSRSDPEAYQRLLLQRARASMIPPSSPLSPILGSSTKIKEASPPPESGREAGIIQVAAPAAPLHSTIASAILDPRPEDTKSVSSRRRSTNQLSLAMVPMILAMMNQGISFPSSEQVDKGSAGALASFLASDISDALTSPSDNDDQIQTKVRAKVQALTDYPVLCVALVSQTLSLADFVRMDHDELSATATAMSPSGHITGNPGVLVRFPPSSSKVLPAPMTPSKPASSATVLSEDELASAPSMNPKVSRTSKRLDGQTLSTAPAAPSSSLLKQAKGATEKPKQVHEKRVPNPAVIQP
ncbi:MAG: hypothetical protein M1838_004027 [Thelocarpon superellum]|nr:MAG: hypothetical protein M1838_004027 [Thelocarpon superellum]